MKPMATKESRHTILVAQECRRLGIKPIKLITRKRGILSRIIRFYMTPAKL